MMKTTLIGLASIAVASVVATAQGQTQLTQVSARHNAPLKAQPNPKARILATVPRGSALRLNYCDAQQWCRVQFGNRVGWMAAVNLNLPAHGTGTLRANALLRAGPGEHFTGLLTLYGGTHVSVIECQPQWCQVKAGTRQGWIARTLIDQGMVGPQPPAPIAGSELRMFTGRNCTGNTYSTLVSVPSLNYPVQSARVINGTGNPAHDTWQLCVSANYNGSCTSTTASCSNLDEIAGRGTVRSVRRYGEGMAGTPAPGICTKEYLPVCARSGRRNKTFGNACEARAAGATIQHQGQCR